MAHSGRRAERLRDILEVLGRDGAADHTDLAEALGVTSSTIRRDLAHLESQGFLVRTRGGAVPADGPMELPVRYRDSTMRAQKLAIATVTAEIIGTQRTAVALCGGSTAAEVARTLAYRSELTIVTNAITTAMEIVQRGKVKVVMTGGLIRPVSLELVGSLAEHTFNAINVHTAVLGADGISATTGVTTHDEIEARTNRSMVLHAERVIAVADSSKLGQTAFAKVADLAEIDILVTDDGAPASVVEALRAEGLDVRVARVDAPDQAAAHAVD